MENINIVLSEIRTRLRNNKTIAKNTGYLSIVEFIRLFLPFVALPYVIRTVGAERYGMIAFAQTIVQYFIIIINFGLDISAVRDVSIHRDDKMVLNEIVSTVLSIKMLLLLLSLVLLIVGMLVVPFMSEHPLLMSFAFFTCLSELLFPLWFFQGLEKMKYITIVRSSSLIFYTVTVFIFVRQQSDYELVALLQSMGNVFAGIIAFYCLVRMERVRLLLPSASMIRQIFRDALPFWFSRVSVVFNMNLAKTVSGLFLSMESVAAFDLAHKITNAILIPTRMLNQSAYPHIARNQDRRFATRLVGFVTLTALCLSLFTCLFAPLLIRLFAGSSMPEAVSILRVFCIFMFTTSIVISLGSSMLIPLGHPQPFNTSVILSTLVIVLTYSVIYLLGIRSSVSLALALVLGDLFVLCYRGYFCRKYRLLVR